MLLVTSLLNQIYVRGVSSTTRTIGRTFLLRGASGMGKSKEKRGTLSYFRFDPNASAVAFDDLLTNREPMPVPGYSFLLWSRLKMPNIWVWNLFGIPIPLSRTANNHASPWSFAEITIRGGASLRYLSAFETRF